MSSFEIKPNTGSLFKNENKTKETQPDYRGDAMVNGEKVEIAAWLKTAKSGKKYMSLNFQEPRQREDKPKAAPKTAPDFEDEIPFAWAFAVPAGLLGWLVYGATLPGV